MATLKIVEGGIVDIDSGKKVGTIHLRECGKYYFRESVFIENLPVDEWEQVRTIIDTLNNEVENIRTAWEIN